MDMKEGFLTEEAGRRWPEHASIFFEARRLREEKLWHEYTVLLEGLYDVVSKEKDGYALKEVYEGAIRPLEDKLHPFRTAKLAVLASERIEDPSQAIDFLRGTSERASQSRANESQQAALLLRLAVAKLHVQSGRIGDAKTIVQESRSQIEGMHDPAMELQAAFYSSSCDIFKANRQFSQFYKSALTYLAYANVDTLPMEERTIVGVDLILAALLGDDTYAFGELLRNPVVVELKTGPHQWLYALLQSVDAGDLQRFREVCIQNGPYFEAQPLLVSNRHKLEQKTSLLSLVNHITASATANAQFSFQSLSSSSKIPLEDVERLVMRAISLQLISGHMDEVTQVLTVTWVMPKQLTDAEVKQREEKVDVWSGRVHNVLLELENEVPELLLEA